MLTDFYIFRIQTVLSSSSLCAVKICWSWGGAKGHIVGLGADPKGTSEAPKGTVLFGKSLVRTLVVSECYYDWLVDTDSRNWLVLHRQLYITYCENEGNTLKPYVLKRSLESMLECMWMPGLVHPCMIKSCLPFLSRMWYTMYQALPLLEWKALIVVLLVG